MSASVRVALTVNGQAVSVDAHPVTRLLDVLREHLGLTGTKEGCGEGECGACAVLVDGRLLVSCLVPIGQLDGADVLTIEGLARPPADDEARTAAGSAASDTGRGIAPGAGDRGAMPARPLAPIQEAMLAEGGAQCGICTPGIVLAAHALLESTPRPTRDEIREALAGNLCRCTGYTAIYAAVERAAAARDRR